MGSTALNVRSRRYPHRSALGQGPVGPLVCDTPRIAAGDSMSAPSCRSAAVVAAEPLPPAPNDVGNTEFRVGPAGGVAKLLA